MASHISAGRADTIHSGSKRADKLKRCCYSTSDNNDFALRIAVVGGSGLLTMVREEVRLGTVRWNPFARTRL
jgi:hypothetical protein